MITCCYNTRAKRLWTKAQSRGRERRFRQWEAYGGLSKPSLFKRVPWQPAGGTAPIPREPESPDAIPFNHTLTHSLRKLGYTLFALSLSLAYTYFGSSQFSVVAAAAAWYLCLAWILGMRQYHCFLFLLFPFKNLSNMTIASSCLLIKTLYVIHSWRVF